MIVNTDIFDFYMKVGNIDKFKEDPLFRYINELNDGETVFKEPSYSQKEIQTMMRISTEIRHQIDNFKPNNIELWDILFPDWQGLISNVEVYFIVGLTEGYDALAIQDESGDPIVVYDIGNWLIYQNMAISNVANNLLTHELSHICINYSFPKLKETFMTGTYLERLDVITFDEGFAHLLAFRNKNIAAVDWKSEQYRKILSDNISKMSYALDESDISKQNMYIQTAMTGNYYEKFGAMVGMLYLADQWLENGNSGLKKVFDEGYYDFAARASSVKL